MMLSLLHNIIKQLMYWDIKEGLCTWHHALYFESLCTDWLGTQFQRFMFANPLPPPLVVFCILFSD